MAPKYLTSKYKLFLLYYGVKDYYRARNVGYEILSATYKIRDTQTLRMLADVKNRLKKIEYCSDTQGVILDKNDSVNPEISSIDVL